MDVTIIGTGNMARGIGARALAGGHNLTIVGKDEQRAQDAASALPGGAKTGLTGDPIDGDLIVLAVDYPDARGAVEQYADQLSGKPVVDITNPVNETFDGLVVPGGRVGDQGSPPRSPPRPGSSRPSTPRSRARWKRVRLPGSRSTC